MGQTSYCFDKFILFSLAKAGTLIMAMDPLEKGVKKVNLAMKAFRKRNQGE